MLLGSVDFTLDDCWVSAATIFGLSVPELLGFEFRRSHLQVKEEVGKQLGSVDG